MRMATFVSTGLLLAAVPLLLSQALAQAQAQEVSFRSTEVAPGLHMLEGVGGFTGGNLGLLSGADGIVLIDDGIGPLAAKTIEAVLKISGEPVDFVINTHVHGDHSGGNAALHKHGATIVGHKNIRARMLAEPAPEYGGAAGLPQLTFSDAVTFHLNGIDARAMHVKHAHTDGDAIIHFPSVDVIHTGDVFFNGLYPFIDQDSGGSVAGYIAAQHRVLALAGPDTKIIPGHGPLATRADLLAANEMLTAALASVKKLVAAGKTEAEVLAADPLAGWHEDWSWGFIDGERMTRTLYRSLTR